MNLKSLYFIIPWSFFAIAVLITRFTNLEFNGRWLELLSIFVFTTGFPFVFFLNTSNNLKRKSLLISSFFLLVMTATILRFQEFLPISHRYKTQTVMYRLKSNPETRIEFQMEDVGAFGYNRRTVEITPCFYFFSSLREVEENAVYPGKWYNVNEDVNELELTYP